MNLAKLFYLKETFRTRVREWRQACFRQHASRRHARHSALSTSDLKPSNRGCCSMRTLPRS